MNRNDIRAWIAGFGNWLINIFFPRRCPICGEVLPGDVLVHPKCRRLLTETGERVCRICGRITGDTGNKLCRECEKRRPAFREGRSLWLHDRFMSRSLYEFKYANCREYADFYAQELYRRYAGQLAKWEITALVPVPVHKKKKKVRGYNQTELAAERLSVLTGIPLHTSWLIRIRETSAQKDLTRFGRFRNLEKAFVSPEGLFITGNICLIDDIYTTGATLENCARVLKKAGAANVYFLTLTTGEDG